jgi:hypothetical protein
MRQHPSLSRACLKAQFGAVANGVAPNLLLQVINPTVTAMLAAVKF